MAGARDVVRCGCGRRPERAWAQVLESADRAAFVLCERCVRDRSKRQHLAMSLARGQFGPGATLVWRIRIDGIEYRAEVGPGDREGRERFLRYDER